jgi:hypothetical protein
MRFTVLLTAGSLMAAATHVAMAAPGLQLTPNQVVAYKGSVRVTQSSGTDVLGDNRYEAYLLCSIHEAPGETLRLFTTRMLEPGGVGATAMTFDELSVHGTPGSAEGLTLEFVTEPQPEQEESFAQMAVYFPVDILPQFPFPAVGQKGRVETEVSVMTFDTVKIAFEIELAKEGPEGSRLEATRALAAGAKPAFQFRGEPGTVDTWSERYVLAAGSGLPERLEAKLVLDVKYQGGPLRIERTLELEAVPRNVSSDKDSAELAQELRQITAEFEARKPVDGIAKRVTAFGALVKSSPTFQPAAKALTKRILDYRSQRLGAKAADFTLEGLDGKKVAFQEAIRGKVTLLAFWAYG